MKKKKGNKSFMTIPQGAPFGLVEKAVEHMQKAEQPRLLDLLQAALIDPERKLFGWDVIRPENRIKAKIKVVELRNKLATAHKFRLTHEFTEAVVDFSMQSPQTLVKAAGISHPPFDTLWIEWDNKFKGLCSQKYGAKVPSIILESEFAPLAGLFVQKVGEITDAEGAPAIIYKADVISFDEAGRNEYNKIAWYPFGFFHSPHGLMPGLPRVWDSHPLIMLQEHVEKHGWDGSKLDKFFDETNMAIPNSIDLIGQLYVHMWLTNRQNAAMMEWLAQHTLHVIAPPFGPEFEHRLEQQGRLEKLHDIAAEIAGDWRLLLAIFAMMNTRVNVSVIDADAAPTGRTRYIKGKLTPYYSMHTLRLRLPGKKALREVKRDVNKLPIPRRAHWVRRHPRLIVSKTKGAYIKMIDPHVRGDASLGWVDHDYLLDSDKKKKENA